MTYIFTILLKEACVYVSIGYKSVLNVVRDLELNHLANTCRCSQSINTSRDLQAIKASR